MPRYDDVKCSTYGCTGIAKQNGDRPMCRKCQNRMSMRRIRQKEKEEKQRKIMEEDASRPIPIRTVADSIANALIYPKRETWNLVSESIDAYIERRIKEEEKQISHNSDGQITEIDMAVETRDLTNCPMMIYSIKRMAIMIDKTLSFEDKKRKLAKLRKEYNTKSA